MAHLERRLVNPIVPRIVLASKARLDLRLETTGRRHGNLRGSRDRIRPGEGVADGSMRRHASTVPRDADCRFRSLFRTIRTISDQLGGR
jgi:hypothetical protein